MSKFLTIFPLLGAVPILNAATPVANAQQPVLRFVEVVRDGVNGLAGVNGADSVNAVDVQLVINGALGL